MQPPKKGPEEQTEERRDNALRRALNTPPNPKTSEKGNKSQDKREKPGA
jgi:hypothetical protein